MKTHVTLKSGNAKTGPMAVTMREQSSCPTTCPFLGNGCYATGRIFAVPTKYGREDYVAVRALADAPLPYGVRFNVSGDFLADDGTLDVEYVDACNAVADAHGPGSVIAYTHAWRTIPRDAFRFTVNASCETEQDVADAQALGYSEATMVDAPEGTVAGRRVVTCPATAEGSTVTCATCRLCAKDFTNRPVINFPSHGAGKKRASAAVAAAR